MLKTSILNTATALLFSGQWNHLLVSFVLKKRKRKKRKVVAGQANIIASATAIVTSTLETQFEGHVFKTNKLQ